MKVLYFLYFWIYYHNEILISGMALAYTILFKANKIEGGEITYLSKLKKKRHIVLFFNLISMTPGTLSIDLIGTDSIQVHLVDISHKDKAIATMQKLENYIEKML